MENINPNQCQKTEYECPKTNPEEVGLKFDKCQIHKLVELKNKAEKNQDGTEKDDADKNYTEIYKFIQDQLPDNKSKDQKGFDRWLDFGISTNAKSGDIIDVTLRNVSKEAVKRALGSEYKNQYDDDEEFYKQYKEISNQTAKKMIDDLANGCKIDTDYIVHLDAENFQKFDQDFDPINGINSGRVKREDWSGAPSDEYMFGKNYIKANNWDLKDSFLGEFSTLIDFNKIKSPTTAMSMATQELSSLSIDRTKNSGAVGAIAGIAIGVAFILATGGVGIIPIGLGAIGGGAVGGVGGVGGGIAYSVCDTINKIIKLRDEYANSGQFPKRYAKYDCESKKKREEENKASLEAIKKFKNDIIHGAEILLPKDVINYINSTAEKIKKQFKKIPDLFQPKKEEDSMKLINIKNAKLEKLGAYGLSFSTSEGLSPGILKEKEANIGDFKTKEEYFKYLYDKADKEEDYNADKEEQEELDNNTYRLSFESEMEDIDLTSLLKEGVGVRIELEQYKGHRYYYGYVISAQDTGQRDDKYTYDIELGTWVWFLKQNKNSKIYQNLNILEIIQDVFSRYDTLAEYKLDILEVYPKREYCVQFNESDFDFVNRLLEYEGVWYYFIHEANKHTMVITDKQEFPELKGIYSHMDFIPDSEDHRAIREGIQKINMECKIVSNKVLMRDYDYLNPRKDLNVSVDDSFTIPNKLLECYTYSQNYVDSDRGNKLAQLRLEQKLSSSQMLSGSSNALGLEAGRSFNLSLHPDDERNTKYKILGVKYTYVQDGPDSSNSEGRNILCFFRGLKSDVIFRPELVVSAPVVSGIQSATVVGTVNSEVYTDKHSRIKVHFHWDRYKTTEEDSSCWIRVVQAWSGKGWGVVAMPRVGQEVLINYIDGDLDRPLVVGIVYNGDNVPPYKLPKYINYTGLVSRSLKFGRPQHASFLTFDDNRNNERVIVHYERDVQEVAERNDAKFVGQDLYEYVKRIATSWYNSHFSYKNFNYNMTGASVSFTGVDISHTGLNISNTGMSFSTTGMSTSFTGNSTSFTGNSTSFTGNSMSFTGNSTSYTGNSVSATGSSSSFVSSSKKVVGISESYTGSSESTTGSSVSVTGSSISTTGSSVSTTGSSISTTGSSISVTGSSVSTTGSSVSITGSSVSVTGSSVSNTGSSISTTGSSISVTGSSISNTGVKISYTGVSSSKTGLEIKN